MVVLLESLTFARHLIRPGFLPNNTQSVSFVQNCTYMYILKEKACSQISLYQKKLQGSPLPIFSSHLSYCWSQMVVYAGGEKMINCIQYTQIHLHTTEKNIWNYKTVETFVIQGCLSSLFVLIVFGNIFSVFVWNISYQRMVDIEYWSILRDCSEYHNYTRKYDQLIRYYQISTYFSGQFGTTPDLSGEALSITTLAPNLWEWWRFSFSTIPFKNNKFSIATSYWYISQCKTLSETFIRLCSNKLPHCQQISQAFTFFLSDRLLLP